MLANSGTREAANAGAEEGDDEEKGIASRGGESTQIGLCNDVPVEARVEGASVSFGSSGMGFEGLGTKVRLRSAGVSMSSFGDAFDLKKCCMEVVLIVEKRGGGTSSVLIAMEGSCGVKVSALDICEVKAGGAMLEDWLVG